IAISDLAAIASGELVEFSGIAPIPAGQVELAHPEHGVDLRNNRHSPAVNTHPRIVDEWQSGRQDNAFAVSPAFFPLPEHLHPPTAWLSSLGATFALIALAQGEQIVSSVTAHVSDGFKSLVAALKSEVGRPLFEKCEFMIVLNDHGLIVPSF